jgi:dTMP kinase
MGQLIVFSGTDGAGKSTQIGLLESYLKGKGHKVARFWARGGYTPLFLLLKKMLRTIHPNAVPKPGPSNERTQKLKSSRVRVTWLLLANLDLIICYGLWVRLKMWLGYTVLCDRYVDDSLFDFNRNFPSENIESWYTWRILAWFSPKPRHRFLLIVRPEVSILRSKLKNEPYPDPPETLNWRYDRYQELAITDLWVVLDGSQSIKEVHNRILGEIVTCD